MPQCYNLISDDTAQSPADVMEYSAVSEVLDADYEAAGTCSEDLYVHAFNPVCSASRPELKGACSTPTTFAHV